MPLQTDEVAWSEWLHASNELKKFIIDVYQQALAQHQAQEAERARQHEQFQILQTVVQPQPGPSTYREPQGWSAESVPAPSLHVEVTSGPGRLDRMNTEDLLLPFPEEIVRLDDRWHFILCTNDRLQPSQPTQDKGKVR